MRSLIKVNERSTAYWALRAIGLALVIGFVLWIPTSTQNGTISDITDAFSLMIAAMSLNLLMGFTGQISLGHSAFFGVGAYSTGILVAKYDQTPWPTFFVAFAVAFVVGMVVSLPALRIKGIYLALVTLALAQLFPQLLTWKKLVWLTNGSKGLDKAGFNPKMRHFEIFGWDPFGDVRGSDGKTLFHYWIAFVLVVITYVVCRGVVRSRFGRSMIAIRDNETAAAVMGVNAAVTKALAFGVSAGLCSLAGCLSAIRTGNVVPDSTNLKLFGAIIFLIVMVIGGIGTLWGPIVGAMAYVFVGSATSDWADDERIPALIRPLLGWSKITPSDGVFALLLIALVFFAPYGLVGLWNRIAKRVIAVVPRPAGTAVLSMTSPGSTGEEDQHASPLEGESS